MTKHPRLPVAESWSPELVADLLDVVAEHHTDHALRDLEQLVTSLRAGADEAAEARQVLSQTPTEVLRQALLLRAARIGLAR